ncbi:MAG: hypothetical protein HBSAPP03_24430 [Phycisphaerae bacterium]|nr:MAG: hypothetical protein HBSAPP03_24430 [Phycisphaerae bacterium]
MSTISTVAVTGGSGFVGRTIVQDLVAAGYQVRVLTRNPEAARRALPRSRVTVLAGDLLDSARVTELLASAQACINLAGILREVRRPGRMQTFERVHVQGPRLLVERCRAMGIRRFVHMSAINVRDVACCAYQRTKWEGELAVRGSDLDWTIFRPGLIHGPASEFVRMIATLASGHVAPYLFIPYFGREVEDTRVPLGAVTLADPMTQPIDVRDVARAFVASLTNPATVGEVYNLVGSEVLPMPDVLRHIRDHAPGTNHDLEPHAMPAGPAACAAMAAEFIGVGSWLPFDEGMARMAAEDTTASHDKVRADLGLEFRPFRAAFKEYAASLA